MQALRPAAWKAGPVLLLAQVTPPSVERYMTFWRVGQAAAPLVHRRHVNPATALQVAGDLDVADEAGVEWHRRSKWCRYRSRSRSSAPPPMAKLLKEMYIRP